MYFMHKIEIFEDKSFYRKGGQVVIERFASKKKKGQISLKRYPKLLPFKFLWNLEISQNGLSTLKIWETNYYMGHWRRRFLHISEFYHFSCFSLLANWRKFCLSISISLHSLIWGWRASLPRKEAPFYLL